MIGPGELLLVVYDLFAIDQTLAGFIKPKHPAKGERRKRKREDPTPSQNCKNPKWDLQSQFKFDGGFENK